jgi:hypothetical protein
MQNEITQAYCLVQFLQCSYGGSGVFYTATAQRFQKHGKGYFRSQDHGFTYQDRV